MKIIRHTKIRLETRELKVVRFRGNSYHFCQNCQTQRQLLTITETVLLLKISERELFRLIASGQIHPVETTDGKLLICPGFISNKR